MFEDVNKAIKQIERMSLQRSERDKMAERFRIGVINYPDKISQMPIDQIEEERTKWCIAAMRFPVMEKLPRPIYIITDDPIEQQPTSWWQKVKKLIKRNKSK